MISNKIYSIFRNSFRSTFFSACSSYSDDDEFAGLIDDVVAFVSLDSLFLLAAIFLRSISFAAAADVDGFASVMTTSSIVSSIAGCFATFLFSSSHSDFSADEVCGVAATGSSL